MRILFVHPNYRSGGAEIAGANLGDQIAALAPDVVGVTAITPSIYRA